MEGSPVAVFSADPGSLERVTSFSETQTRTGGFLSFLLPDLFQA